MRVKTKILILSLATICGVPLSSHAQAPINAGQYITVNNGGGSSYRVGLNGQTDGYIHARNSSGEDKVYITTNGSSYFNGGNIGIGVTNPSNKLQIGVNPNGWNGNDLVLSNSNGGLAIFTDPTHTYLIGSHDIAVRPNGRWSLYSKASTGYVGVGFTDPTAMLHVFQGGTDWASIIQNVGGSGKGLLVKSASGDNLTPTFQVEDNHGISRFRVNTNGYTEIGGDVGFTSPGKKIQYYGDANHRAQITMYDGANGNINIENYWNEGDANIFLRPDKNVHIRHGDNATAGIFVLQSGSGSYEVTNNKILFTGTETGTTANPYGLRKDIQWLVGQEAGQSFTIRHGPAETEMFRIKHDGNIGVGTNNPTQKLTVKGTVYSTEVKVDVNAGSGPDYVFEPSYNLPTLAETEAYIKANKHLPEVPSAKEMEANGINLSEMNMLLLKKVEELTLHVIEQQKQNERQQKEIEYLKTKVE